MSVELLERREQAERKISELLAEIDGILRQMYVSLLKNDTAESLTEEQAVARLEGFHDYIVVREATGVEHPSLEEFLAVRKDRPGTLLSFGTGVHREVFEDDDAIDDTVSDEDLRDLELEDEIETFEGEGGHLPAQEISAASAESADESDEEEDVAVEATENEVVSPVVKVASPGPVFSSADSATSAPSADSAPEVAEDDKVEEKETEKVEERVPGRIDSAAIVDKEFTDKRGGYNRDQVDDLLDGVSTFLESDHSVEEYGAMVNTLKANQFKTSAFRSGYNPIEVDGFIAAIVAELQNRTSA